MKRTVAVTLFILTVHCTNAATVDTISIYSNAMHKEFKCVVIRPSVLQDETHPLPVVYLLHGHSGWYSNWIIRVPQLKDYADRYSLMIVCPDGGMASWYFDSPVDSSMKYETYISKEVPEYIDAHYFTIKDRKARAITGLSMGGHGALFLAFRHSETFGSCGSMSGCADLRPFSKSWGINKLIGDSLNYSDNWKNYSVITLAEQKPADSLAIIIDCGTEDFFYEVNKSLHQKLLQQQISHDYTERPGKHDWAYWKNAVQFQLLFFSKYFDKNKKD
jgi:S-formylglutathione hydrolase FrmB